MKMKSLALLTACTLVSTAHPDVPADYWQVKEVLVNVLIKEGHDLMWDRYVAIEAVSNNGTIQHSEKVRVKTAKLTGNGVIKAPKILLEADEFDFTGTIECSDHCTIVSENEVNKDSFKLVGNGKLELLKKVIAEKEDAKAVEAMEKKAEADNSL